MTLWMNFKKPDQSPSSHLRITHILSVLTLFLFVGMSTSPAHALTGSDVSPGDACATEDAVMMTANGSGNGGYILTCESGEWVATMNASLPTANEQVATKEYVDTVAAAGGGNNGRFQTSCWGAGNDAGRYNYCVITDTQTGQTSCRSSYQANSASYPWMACGAGSLNVSSLSGGSISIPEAGVAEIYAANAYGWGHETAVGDGATSAAQAPKLIDLNLTFTKIVAGGTSSYRHACGIASNKAYCWGKFYSGYNGGAGFDGDLLSPAAMNVAPIGYPSITDIAVGKVKTAIRTSSGTWYGFGATENSTISYQFGAPPGGSAITSSSILRWFNSSSTLVDAPTDFTKFALGSHHACGLRSNGNVHCMSAQGSTSYNLKAIGAAANPVHGEACNGTSNQMGVQTHYLTEGCYVMGGHTFTDIAVSAPSSYLTSCAVATDGEIYCWGGDNNTYGALGNGSTAYGTGEPQAVDKTASGAVTFEKVYGSSLSPQGFFCGLDTDGNAYCWGANGNGQLGTGDTSDRARPTLVLGNYSFDELALGEQHTCGVTTAGTLYCWGAGSHSRLGYGGSSNKLIPEPVAGGTGYVGIAANGYNSYAWK